MSSVRIILRSTTHITIQTVKKKKKLQRILFFVENVVTAVVALAAFIDGLLSSGSLGGSVVQWFELGIWYKGI